MARNKQLDKLRKLIKLGTVPDTERIDWVEIYKFWLLNKDVKIKTHKARKLTTVQRYKGRARTINSRAKSKGATGTVSYQDLIDTMDKYDNKCSNCGTTMNLVFDHIKSLYSGGTNTKDNLQVLCRICNMIKGV